MEVLIDAAAFSPMMPHAASMSIPHGSRLNVFSPFLLPIFLLVVLFNFRDSLSCSADDLVLSRVTVQLTWTSEPS